LRTVVDMRSLPASDPGEPDTRSATRLLLWIWRDQWGSQLLGAFWGVLWMLSIALIPAAVGRAVDRGLIARSSAGLLTWAGAVLGLSVMVAIAGGMRHRNALTNWLSAAYLTIQVTVRHAVRVGAALPAMVNSGDVVAISSTDTEAVGSTFDITARLTGALVTVTVVALIMLDMSVTLGLVVLIGVPAMMALTAILLRPLHRRQDRYRTLQGKLTDQTIDIAQGIRVLRGIGGEEAFSARYTRSSRELRTVGLRVGRIESLLAGQEVLLPGLLTALVTWLAARFALRGEVTLGQLVAFYGYAAFLALPLATFGEAADAFTRGHVAATHVVSVLRLASSIASPAEPVQMPPPGVPLTDAESGLTVRAGQFIAVACADPADADALGARLARYADDGSPALGGVPLSSLALPELRSRILLARNSDRYFPGTLRDSLRGRVAATDQTVLAALDAVSAQDILDGLPDGLDAEVAEKGRNFSGGQLQRLRLARALLADPEILIAVEATSAVDAHTEARIAARLGPYRAGRGTVLFSASPLVLDHAESVAYVEDGKVIATGTHAELLAAEPRYRALVTREAA
jgi:ABC-type multidrug transport system fused ATPase/permease subunit